MKRFLVSLFAVILFASQGCGELESVETKQSEIHSISAWATLAGLPVTSVASPVFVRAPGGKWVVYKQASDGLVHITTETFPGSNVFNTTWNTLTGSDSLWGGTAVAVLTNYNPARYFVAVTGLDNQIHAQVQDATGGVVYNPWHIINPGSVFSSAPSVSFNRHPAGSANPTLMIVAMGTDGRTNFTKNVFPVNGPYDPTNWRVSDLVSKTVYSSRPAIVDVCGWPAFIQPTAFITMSRLPSTGAYEYYVYDGLNWSTPYNVIGGLFTTGPALACALGTVFGHPSVEITTTGLGFGPGYQLWYSTQLSSGPQSFTTLGPETFNQNTIPTSYASGTQIRWGAVLGTGIVTKTAVSP